MRIVRGVSNSGPSLRAVLLRYAYTSLHQATQRAACNALHSTSQRCARWLLAAGYTAGGTRDGFLLTQEYLAYMLSVRREGVSAAARMLRDAGLIHFSRGRIRVLDRSGLEKASCECYDVVNPEYERALVRFANGAVLPAT